MADRALILGINEYKNVNHLQGCVNDTETMRSLLVDIFGFSRSNVEVLTNKQVVKTTIKRKLARLFADAKPGDRVVLHFSGHGSYVDDKDGDEPDGRDELLALYDMDFGDPNSYLLDDELREWTRTKPEGVELTVVLDNCHSGTGTRMLMPAGTGEAERQGEVDPQATVMRTMARAGTARGFEAAPIAASALRPDSEYLVRVRFIDPPDEVKERVRRAAARQKGGRGFVKVEEMNHVLLAACRDDQTAADANIDGNPCGAFTYHLNRAIRNGGAEMTRKALIEKVEAALADGHFEQVPQLEGSSEDGPLFAGNDGDTAKPAPAPATPAPAPATPAPAAGPSVSLATSSATGGNGNGAPQPSSLLALVDKLVPLDVDSRRRVLDLYEQTSTAAPTLVRAVPAAPVSSRHLVYVHGICRHSPGYSDGWWNALHPFTTAFGDGVRGDTRLEVLWSDVVNERAIASRGADDRRALLAAQIRETLQDRVDRHTLESGPRSLPGEAPRALSDPRAIFTIPGVQCVDDFTVYMTDDSIRAEVIARFTEVVRPLLKMNVEVDIVAHSWGTVVAYEGLRELADDGLTTPLVHNLITAGAALSIGAVKLSLRPENQDGIRPAMVHRWVNVNAHGDPVGGALQGRPYQVDFDFPNVDSFGCSSFLGLINPVCAHMSYFVAGNDAVNRDVFAKFIDLT